MAQVPECVVCLQPYDECLHVPRVLACGHSFCEPCLMQLQCAWKSALNTSGKNSLVGGEVIRCPECNHRTRLPVGGRQFLPKNVELLRLLPSLLKESDVIEGRCDREEKSLSPNVDGRDRATCVSTSKHFTGDRSLGRRKSGERRSKGKEEDTYESNCSSRRNCWLWPLDLFSDDVVDGDVRAWIISETAITVRQDEESVTTALCKCFSERALLRGEATLDHDRLSNGIPVTLLRLQVRWSNPKDRILSYEQLVSKAWEEGFSYAIKTELLILFRMSLVCRRQCKVLGLWMNNRNEVFVVSEIPSHEVVTPWEMIIKSCRSQREEMPEVESTERSLKGESCVASDLRSDIHPKSSGILRLELQQTRATNVSSVATSHMVAKAGLALCEALLEVHSQRLILGVVSPRCFVLDRFDNLLFHVNAAIKERFSLHEAMTRYRNSCLSEANVQGQGSAGTPDMVPTLQSSRNCWQYMSPEVLSILMNDDPNKAAGRNGLSVSEEVEQAQITCKADVWSLGCLLLELLSGKVPYDGIAFPEVLHKVLVEREKPGDFLNLVDSHEQGTDCILCSMEVEKHRHLRTLLLKCFQYDPTQRPDVDELWLTLMELESSDLLFRRSVATHGLQNELCDSGGQKYWLFALPGFLVDGSVESLNRKTSQLQESQRHLKYSPDSEAKDDGRPLQACGLTFKESLEGHEDYVTALVVCGDLLLSASFDKTIRVWSLDDHVLLKTLEGHSHVVAALAVDQHTLRCFSGDGGGKICAWKLGEEMTLQPLITTWQEHSDWRYSGVASLAMSGDGILYSGSGDKTIKAWSLQTFLLLGVLAGHKSVVSTLLVDGELLYSGSWDGTIRVWWRSDHSPVAVLDSGSTANLGGVRTLCMTDSFLFSGRDNGAVQVWRDEECLTTIQAHDMVVSTLYVEGDFLYTGSWDEKIKAWQVEDFLSSSSPALSVDCGSALSSIVSDGDRLYAGLAERAIKIYTLLTG